MEENSAAAGETPVPTPTGIADQVLIAFGDAYSIDAYDQKPLPCDLYTAEGVIRARAGQEISRDRLTNSWVQVERELLLSKVTVPVKTILTPSMHDSWEEEDAATIEKRVDAVPFEPFPEVKAGLKKNLHQFKEIFRRHVAGRRILLASKQNRAYSESIVRFLDDLTDKPLHAADYIEIVQHARAPENYTSFAHAAAVAFYALSIAKKLRMLKQDFIDRPSVGRWIPIKTRRHPKAVGTLPFSPQLAKYFDGQKATLQVKYREAEREPLLESAHDLMHDYAAIDFGRPWPSMRCDWGDGSRMVLGMAALNSDIGKLCLPNEVLNTPGALDPTERAMARIHPLLGLFLLKEVEFNIPRALAYVLGHHGLGENGYPRLKYPIFFESRVIGIADMYDAMRSPRFYGRVLSQEEAFAELEARYHEGWFDLPLWVAARHTFEEYNHAFVTKRLRQSQALKE